MKMLKIALFGFIFATLSGCASVAGDNSRYIKVDSAPAGASIYMDNQQFGTTPAIVTLPTYIYGGKTIVLKKRGYQDQAVLINTKFQLISLLDILLWPTIIVDAATGSLVKIDPANLTVNAKMVRA